MTEDIRIYSIWLSELFGQGSRTASVLVSHFGSARDVYNASEDDIDSVEELRKSDAAKVKAKLKNRSLERADYVFSRATELGATILTLDSPEYPKQLRTIRDMPLVLYVRGQLPRFTGYMHSAVVGTRSMTEYGRFVAYSIGYGLAVGGSVVVSGMALGADSMALLGALEAGGNVIAVLGSGVDVIYPREHREIYEKIVNKGAVISEYPPGTPPVGRHFPIRNRIISGLSDATVVVEADKMSGSLITAKHALDQGRKLFAVPGKVGETNSEGTNNLIRDGAIPALSAEDILAEFEFMYSGTVDVQRAHLKLHNLDTSAISKDSMARSRIGTADSSGNYYGSGTYGGRLKDRKNPQKKADSGKNTEASEKTSSDSLVTNEAVESKNKADAKKAEEAQKKTEKTNKKQKTEKQIVNSDKKVVPAKKTELDMLDEIDKRVYNMMKPCVPILPDELVAMGVDISTVLSSLTVLEMAGAVELGGGGYYMRVEPDDITESQND